MKPNSSLPLLLLTLAFGLQVSAAEDPGKAERPRVTSDRPASRVAAPTPAIKWPSVSQARPCDSTACRPVRFAWSPTAPGS